MRTQPADTIPTPPYLFAMERDILMHEEGYIATTPKGFVWFLIGCLLQKTRVIEEVGESVAASYPPLDQEDSFSWLLQKFQRKSLDFL